MQFPRMMEDERTTWLLHTAGLLFTSEIPAALMCAWKCNEKFSSSFLSDSVSVIFTMRVGPFAVTDK